MTLFTKLMSMAGALIALAACTTTQPQHYSGFDAQAWNTTPEERAKVQALQQQQEEMRYHSQQKLVNKNRAEARNAEEFVDTELALRKETVKRGELKYIHRSGTPDTVINQEINVQQQQQQK